jgi:hypothetical protein
VLVEQDAVWRRRLVVQVGNEVAQEDGRGVASLVEEAGEFGRLQLAVEGSSS